MLFINLISYSTLKTLEIVYVNTESSTSHDQEV